MRGSLKRSALAVLGLLLLAGAMLPVAVASAATAQNVPNGEEAWFLKNKEPLTNIPGGDPTCALPTGCNAAGNVQRPGGPHPEGTLVVAATGGDDDAQIFFNFSTEEFPLGAIVTGGSVSMPIAKDEEAGNVNAETASLVACMATGFIPGGAEGGSYNDRPTFDDKTCVPVELDAEAETPTYTFSLDRFGKLWGTGAQTMYGVTVLKDPAVAPPAPDQTWRVVFNSFRRHNNAENPDDFPQITSNLSYKAPPPLDPVDTPAPTGGFPAPADDTTSGSTGSTGGFDSSSAGGFDSGGVATDTGSVQAPVSAGAGSVDAPAAAPPAEQPVAAPAGAPVPAAATGTSPAVWLLPILALAMAGALAWSLMQPVELAGDREGAVSRLMRSRRLAAETTTPA